MWFGVLGTVLVTDRHGEVRIGGPMRRQLLAALLCRAGRPVGADELVDDLWGARPPRSAAKTLQSHVMRLRDDLARGSDRRHDLLVTTDRGYYLDTAGVEIDAARFEQAVRDARALGDDDPLQAAAVLCEALALWRADAYHDVQDAAFVVGERMRLAELRGAARDLHADLALAGGAAATLVPELEARVAAEPYRERAWEQLMLALYRSGRQADALAAFRRVRGLLATELAVEPGDGLRATERMILRGVDVSTAATPVTGRARPQVCPYRGVAGFGVRDATLFVGRERLTAQLAGRLAEPGLVVVTGASGSGKSSLIRAGLVPSLRAGALPGSAAWHVAATTPTALGADDGAHHGGDPAEPGRFADVLVVDQAEEMFLDPALGARTDAVLRAALADGSRVVVVVRGDFVGRLAEVDAVGATRTTVLVRPMRDDELRRVIVEPAARCGLDVENDLVETVLDEISGRTGALPLLAVALERAWDHRDGSVLTLAGYRAGGGIVGALEAPAEDVFTALPADQASAATVLLPRLAVRQGGAWVRRPVPNAGITTPEQSAAVAALAAGRLVTVGDEHVEIVHEALLTGWPRLHALLCERERVADLLDHLSQAAAGWAASRAPEDLYRGARLQAADDWMARHRVDPIEEEFLAASRHGVDAELVEARARADREAAGRRRLRTVLCGLVAVLVVAVAGIAVAVHERGTARAQARRAVEAALVADARRLAASSLTAPDLRTALLLAVAAYRLQDSADTRSALLTALEGSAGAQWRLATAHRLEWLQSDASGRTVWTYDESNNVLRIDTASHRVIGRFPMRGDVVDAVSPDGALIAEGGTNGVDVVLADARTGTVRAVVPMKIDTSADTAPQADFTGDGRWLAIADAVSGAVNGSRVAVLDTSHLSAAPRFVSVGSAITGMTTSDRLVAVTTARGGEVVVVDPRSGRVIGRPRFPGLGANLYPVAMTGDGTRVAAIVDGGRAVLVRAVTGDGVNVRVPVDADIDTLALSPSGRYVAIGSEDGSVLVADTRTGAVDHRFLDDGPVHGLSWAGTSDTTGLFSGGLDSELTEWSLGDAPRLLAWDGPIQPTAMLTAVGDRLIGVSDFWEQGNSVRLYSTSTITGVGSDVLLGLGGSDYVNHVSADVAGDSMLSLTDNAGRAWCEVRARQTGALVSREALPNSATTAPQCALSSDGRMVAASVAQHTIAFYSMPGFVRRREEVVPVRTANGARVQLAPITWLPNGRLLLAGIDPGPPALAPPTVGSTAAVPVGSDELLLDLDVRTRRVVGTLSFGTDGDVNDVAWNRDASRYVVATRTGRVYLISGDHFDQLAQAPAAAGWTLTASFSPDGSLVVTGGTDGSMRFFDGRTLQPIGGPVRLSSQNWWSAVYSGDRVVGIAPSAAGQRWFTFPGTPDAWATAACRLAGSPLTRDEWRRYLGTRPYRDECRAA